MHRRRFSFPNAYRGLSRSASFFPTMSSVKPSAAGPLPEYDRRFAKAPSRFAAFRPRHGSPTVSRTFVVPVIEALLGIQHPQPPASVQARLTVNLASQSGREDWVPVRLIREKEDYLAEPIFGKSNLIFTLTRADGLLCIPPDATGVSTGEIVNVRLF